MPPELNLSFAVIDGVLTLRHGDGPYPGDLDLRGSDVRVIPEGVEVDGVVFAQDTKLEAIGAGLKARALDVSGCRELMALPFMVIADGGYVNISGAAVVEIDPDAMIPTLFSENQSLVRRVHQENSRACTC